MILVNLPGKLVCDEQGCEAHLPVQFSLTASGGFAWRPTVGVTGGGIGVEPSNGVWVCRCPKHHTKVQPAEKPPVEGVRLIQ